MCYSAEVSFLTWGFGIASSLVLYLTGQPVRSFAFPLAVSQMQLVEGLRWVHAMDERILAVLGKIALGIQPAAGLYEAGKTNLVLPYLVVYALSELLFGSKDLRFVVADDGHLKWKWLFAAGSIPAILYWVGLVATTWVLLPLPLWLFFLALYLYFLAGHAKYGTYGSLWCIWVNLMWVYYLLR